MVELATQLPHSDEAEESVVGQLLAKPQIASELVSRGLLPEHFYRPQNRLLFEQVIEGFYADEAVDPLSIGTRLATPLAAALNADERTAVRWVQTLAEPKPLAGAPEAHAKLVIEKSQARRLKRLMASVDDMIGRGKSVEEIAGLVSQETLRITGGVERSGVTDWTSVGDAGRVFVRELRKAKAAREQGLELGAYFGIPAIDEATHGLQPTELLVSGGEPGVGKSMLWWRAGMNFSQRQARAEKGKRVGVGILSLEMGQHPSNIRIAQAFSGLKGESMREGDVNDHDVNHVIREWAARRDLPLWFNYSPKLRCSQLLALASEGIRRHDMGLLIIDHFRMFDLDRRLPNKNDEDEEKVRFLKEDLAGGLNLAVICLAHTRKKDSMSGSDVKPRLSDLRGSGQIAAHSDFVCFVHRPAKYASQEQIDAGEVKRTDAELIWEKNRHGLEGVREFFFEPSSMTAM